MNFTGELTRKFSRVNNCITITRSNVTQKILENYYRKLLQVQNYYSTGNYYRYKTEMTSAVLLRSVNTTSDLINLTSMGFYQPTSYIFSVYSWTIAIMQCLSQHRRGCLLPAYWNFLFPSNLLSLGKRLVIRNITVRKTTSLQK